MRKTVFQLAWPVVIQNLLMTLMMYVDTFMLGRYDQTSLAAMGVNRPLLMAIRLILMAIAVGTLATVARAFGEANSTNKDLTKTRQQIATSLWSAVLIGLVVSSFGALLAPQLISLYIDKNIQPELWIEAVSYFKIVISAFGFTYIFMVGASILRACGDTRSPMLISLYANLFNIAGNYCLIYGNFGFPRMGIEGAALSTALADVIEGVMFIILIFSKRRVINLKVPSLFKVQWENFKTLFKVSFPAMLEPAILQFGMLIVYSMVTGFGEIAIASHMIVLSIESLSFMPGMGFSIACGALVGQYLGAKRIDLAQSAYRESLKIALLIMTSMGLMFVLIPDYLVRIFVDADKSYEVVKLAALCLVIGAIEEPFIALAMIHQGTLRGAGDTKSTAYVAFIGVWLVRLPVAYLFAIILKMGLVGIWLSMPIDWVARSIAFRILYLKGRWKRIKL
ncbi:MAG: MATE family efflux transporter [Planctomycetes bacterium]|nr:MATE family efflux transporter [Planctomycetota bacterium]